MPEEISNKSGGEEAEAAANGAVSGQNYFRQPASSGSGPAEGESNYVRSSAGWIRFGQLRSKQSRTHGDTRRPNAPGSGPAEGNGNYLRSSAGRSHSAAVFMVGTSNGHGGKRCYILTRHSGFDTQL